jgi:hypothetical protein
MAFGSVRLIPGVNVEQTPTLLQASISTCQFIRFRDGLVQKLGGWVRYFALNISGIIRDLHAWEDLNQAQHLLVGSTTTLSVITGTTLQDITPQQMTTNPSPNFSTIMNQTTVTVVDTGISNVTTFDWVQFNTPVSVGGLILAGVYAITSSPSTNTYTITAPIAAASTVNNGGTVPAFTTTSGSSLVSVALTAHGVVQGATVVFPISTSGNGVTINGSYTVASVTDANDFKIQVNTQATASSSFSMNGGNAQLLYYISIGPLPSAAGYGTGGYGTGGYGVGVVAGQQTGTEITSTDWTLDNWGEIALACPSGGGIYQFNPTGAFLNAQLVGQAPIFNNGIFVSTSQQILVAYGAAVDQTQTALPGFGLLQDPLTVSWSDSGDYTNWTPTTTDQAGSFRIPTGSIIRAGLATPNQNLLFTDLDCWAMNYLGPPFVYGFNKIGAGAGAISRHSVLQMRGNVYWMGPANFYSFTGSGLSVLPCTVWDFVFQNLDQNFVQNVRAMPNTGFNEAGFFFPSNASVSGENDCYVKFNIVEPNQPWDYGPSNALPRSAWIDESVLGTPIAATGGAIFQHEVGNNANNVALTPSFTTGYFFIGEGEDFSIVDVIYPDFIWGFFGNPQTAIIQMSFNVTNYPGDVPTTYGPYTVTQQTEYIGVRFRGRQMSITVASSDIGSFWRLGRVRYRYASAGRR